MSKKIEVTQKRSQIGTKPKQRATLKALGLGKVNSHRTHADTPVIRGMIYVVNHLVEVKEVS